MDKRFEKYGIESGEESRNAYRTVLFTTPNLERTISGVILSEDTFSNHTIDGTPTVEYLHNLGIVPGVKVDEGLEPYREGDADGADLFITKGIEALPEKCIRYKQEGAQFLKWRSTIPVSGANDSFLQTIAETLAEYASIAVKNDLVPIIEPEVLMKGSHTISMAAETLERTLSILLRAMREKKCSARNCILKTSFVADGLEKGTTPSDTVAKETLLALKKGGVDKATGFYGVVFLSGGLDTQTATEYVQRIKAIAEQERTDYSFDTPITFSYGRALQNPAMTEWRGLKENILPAQIAFTQTLQHAIKKYKGAEEPPAAGDGRSA